jgi:UDP-glucose 4-epimerase
MRHLVTGGAGFIGSHLCRRLLERGAAVTCLDDLSTGRAANVADLLEHPRFTWRPGSVLDEALVDELVAGARTVHHLAARVGVALVAEQPSATLECNVVGTRNVLQSCVQHRARVVLASSSEVYGKNESPPFQEDGPLLLGATREPRWSYACSKAWGEWLAFAHARESGLKVLVVRFFNVVGPFQRPDFGMVLPRLVRAARGDRPLTVYGDGRQTRCFLHVEDAVSAVLALTEAPAAWGQVVNVGSDEEVSIGDLAERVRAASGTSAPIVHMPFAEVYGTAMHDFVRRVPDLSRLRGLTSFRPTRDLDAVVAELIHARPVHDRSEVLTRG